MIKKVVYPGTFDPFTLGHLDVIHRGCKIFDEIIIGVASDGLRAPWLKNIDRKKIIEAVIQAENLDHQVKVDIIPNLTISYMQEHKISLILRGVRLIADFENEMSLYLNNTLLSEETIDSVFMFTSSRFSHISSTTVKSLFFKGADLKNYIHPIVNQFIQDLK